MAVLRLAVVSGVFVGAVALAVAGPGEGPPHDPESPSDDTVMRDNIARLGGDPTAGFDTGAGENTLPMEPQFEPPDSADPVVLEEDPIINTVEEQ